MRLEHVEKGTTRMQKTDVRYQAFVTILNEQLRPAMGCTEPIAIAYAAALARRILGEPVESARVRVSGNIIKNAKSVTVPNTDGKKGIEAACAAGIIGGDPDLELEVISRLTQEDLNQVDELLLRKIIRVELLDEGHIFDILIELKGSRHTASVRITDRHTNVVMMERDGQSLMSSEQEKEICAEESNEELLTIESIFDFASTCDIADVEEPIARQIAMNTAISEAGMREQWGACIGRIWLKMYGEQDLKARACAYAAAGSDARMGGCDLPVVINSGSGNQGITVSVPVIEYAKAMGASKEKLYRALVLSNLVAIHQKSQIGCLSAYCGVVSAGSAAGAGIAFLEGGDLYLINHTIVNSLAILSGTICDGAKASCAAKIANAVNAALLAYHMALSKQQFRAGDGIIKKGVENTIHSVSRLARDGMAVTDQEILKIMIDQ